MSFSWQAVSNGIPLSDLSGLFAVNHFLYGSVILVEVLVLLGLSLSIVKNQPFGFFHAVREARGANNFFGGLKTWVKETRDALNRFWVRGPFFWLAPALLVPLVITYGDPTAYRWMVLYGVLYVVGGWVGDRLSRRDTSVEGDGNEVGKALVSRLTGIEDHHVPNAVLVMLTVILLMIFGLAFYEDVPRALGGGRPTAVNVTLVEEVQPLPFQNGEFASAGPVELYYRSSSFTGLRLPGCDSVPGILIPNSNIAAVTPLDTAASGCRK